VIFPIATLAPQPASRRPRRLREWSIVAAAVLVAAAVVVLALIVR
jgi:hypothetical protein